VCPTLNTQEVWTFLGNEWGVKPDSVRMYVSNKHRLDRHKETLKNYIEFFEPHTDNQEIASKRYETGGVVICQHPHFGD